MAAEKQRVTNTPDAPGEMAWVTAATAEHHHNLQALDVWRGPAAGSNAPCNALAAGAQTSPGVQ